MQKSATGNFHSGSPAVRPSRVSQVRATSREQNRPPVPGCHRPIFGLRGSHRSAPRPALMALEVCSSGTSRPIADVPLTAVDDPGCVTTLRGITAPGILGPMVMRRAKNRKNLSSARHYDQIRFRFHTTKTHKRHAAKQLLDHLVSALL